MSEDENPVVQSLMRLSERATESGLSEYLLIGGNAVIAYGVPRFTRDLDFVIPDREKNDWRCFLEANGFQFVHGTPAFVQFQDKDLGRPRVDLMLVGESTWSQLQSMARAFELTDEISIPPAFLRTGTRVLLTGVTSSNFVFGTNLIRKMMPPSPNL